MKGKKRFIGFIVLVMCFISFGVTAFAGETQLKNKKWVSGQGGVYETDKDGTIVYNSYGTVYYKIKIPKQGYIIVDVKTSSLPGEDDYNAQDDEYDGELSEPGVTNVDLLSSSKKVLSANSNNLTEKKNYSFSWAVKKGTYYLAVSGDQKYNIRYAFTAVTKVSKSGASAKNAVSLKKGKLVKDLLLPRKYHYFKIDLPKKTKVTIVFDSKLKDSNSMELTMVLAVKKGKDYRFVDGKGKLVAKNNAVWWEIKGKEKVTLNLPKGTYYVRMDGGSTSGYYTMKWK